MALKSTLSKYFNGRTVSYAVPTLALSLLATIRFVEGDYPRAIVSAGIAATTGFFWLKEINKDSAQPPSP